MAAVGGELGRQLSQTAWTPADIVVQVLAMFAYGYKSLQSHCITDSFADNQS
jgi:hypothetical protein